MRRSLILAGVLMLASPVLADSAPLPKPGYWISDNKVLSPISTDKSEKRCLSQKDVNRFVSGLQRHPIVITDYVPQWPVEELVARYQAAGY